MSDEKDTKPEAAPDTAPEATSEDDGKWTIEKSKFEERPDMPGVPWFKTRRGIRVV